MTVTQAAVAAHTTAPTRSLSRPLRIVLMLALVLPGAVAILVLLTLNLNKAVEVDARARAEQFADLLQAGLTLPLWNVAIDTGRPLLSAVVADTSVADVEVRDADGEMLLEFHRRRDKPSAMIEIKRTITKDTERLGEVKLYYSTASAQGEAWQSAWVVAGVVTSQFVASMLLIGIWLHRRVLRPLYRLHDSAAAITAGDLHTTLPTLRPDEFGALAKQLDFMRASLAQSVEALEERVNARTAEVQHANSELQSAMDHLQKTQERLIQTEKLASLGSLVAGVAHELNTPIGNGVLVLSTLASQAVEFQSKMAAGLTRSQLDHFVAQVQEGANIGLSSLNRAAELIQDFKQMAVDQTSLRRRRFDLQQVVSETIATISVVYKNSPVRCEIEVPAGIQMESHPGAISQIVSNLYDNAMIHAFANRSGLISITAERRDDQVLVRIADNGTGIAPENLGRIFDPFYTTRLGSGGSGLGLSIVYGLVSGLLGGHIEVTSEWGNGTCFSMVLPRVAPIHEDAQPSQ